MGEKSPLCDPLVSDLDTVHVFVCVQVHMVMYDYVYTCGHMSGGQRSVSAVVLQVLSTWLILSHLFIYHV